MFFLDKQEYEEYLSRNEINIYNSNSDKYFEWDENGHILLQSNKIRTSSLDVS